MLYGLLVLGALQAANGSPPAPSAGQAPLETDRPDFGAATTTVGRGRAILESGYSYYRDHASGARVDGRSFPDAVLRIGLFSDWFEFRIGQSFAEFDAAASGEPGRSGAQDLYLGVKAAFMKRQGWRPESAIIVQSTVPTGSRALTGGRMLTGAVFLASWAVADGLSFSGALEGDQVVGDSGRTYVRIAHALNVEYAWTRRLRTFVEWVAFHAAASATGTGPEHYVHPGMTCLVTRDIQLDAHLYLGLNRRAMDAVGGVGASFRF